MEFPNMFDTSNEQVFLLCKAKDRVPGRPSLATLHRWALKGIRGVKLDTALIGGRRYTSREAVARFVDRLSEPRAETAHAPAPSKIRSAQIVAAARRAAKTF